MVVIADVVRVSEELVRRWLRRYLVEGVEGLRDALHPRVLRRKMVCSVYDRSDRGHAAAESSPSRKWRTSIGGADKERRGGESERDEAVVPAG